MTEPPTVGAARRAYELHKHRERRQSAAHPDLRHDPGPYLALLAALELRRERIACAILAGRQPGERLEHLAEDIVRVERALDKLQDATHE